MVTQRNVRRNRYIQNLDKDKETEKALIIFEMGSTTTEREDAPAGQTADLRGRKRTMDMRTVKLLTLCLKDMRKTTEKKYSLEPQDTA